MSRDFNKMVELFSGEHLGSLLRKGKWGIEREALRYTPDGKLSNTPHPSIFKERFFNSNVVTDFSESQVELITPPCDSIGETLLFLNELTENVNCSLENEILWPQSMPGPLPDDSDIPIAKYENTPGGRRKEIYRQGLAARYGKKVQMISGIHFNFSFDEDLWKFLIEASGLKKGLQQFIDESYFGLVRNILRYRWLLIYLFGASPVADNSYKTPLMQKIEERDCFDNLARGFEFCTRYATSLRTSRFGYENAGNSRLEVSYNSLAEYIKDLKFLLSTKDEQYFKIGIYKDGQQIQLNNNTLQLENEFYSSVRFKQVVSQGETQLCALEKRGVQYIELRAFDINPFEKTGLNSDQLYFTQVFLLFCLFENSDFFKGDELEIANMNANKVSLMGRLPGVKLNLSGNETKTIPEWGNDIMKKCITIARIMDKSTGNNGYEDIVRRQAVKLNDTEHLPSERMVMEMEKNREDYLAFNLRKAFEHRSYSLKELGADIA